MIGQEQRQLDASVSGVQQVDRIGGSRGLMRGVGGQARRGAAGQVGLPGVAEREGERGRRASGRPRGAAGQELPQSSLKVSHEQRVDDGIHGAVAVAQPGDGIKEGEGDTLTHSLGTERKVSYWKIYCQKRRPLWSFLFKIKVNMLIIVPRWGNCSVSAASRNKYQKKTRKVNLQGRKMCQTSYIYIYMRDLIGNTVLH